MSKSSNNKTDKILDKIKLNDLYYKLKKVPNYHSTCSFCQIRTKSPTEYSGQTDYLVVPFFDINKSNTLMPSKNTKWFNSSGDELKNQPGLFTLHHFH